MIRKVFTGILLGMLLFLAVGFVSTPVVAINLTPSVDAPPNPFPPPRPPVPPTPFPRP